VPSADEIKDFLSGASPVSTQNYLCRCGAHTRIVAAIQLSSFVKVLSVTLGQPG
jgi:aerobic-type carbon monoxide dehydrogenase small subunit (CoxS/CutS family)